MRGFFLTMILTIFLSACVHNPMTRELANAPVSEGRRGKCLLFKSNIGVHSLYDGNSNLLDIWTFKTPNRDDMQSFIVEGACQSVQPTAITQLLPIVFKNIQNPRACILFVGHNNISTLYNRRLDELGTLDTPGFSELKPYIKNQSCSEIFSFNIRGLIRVAVQELR